MQVSMCLLLVLTFSPRHDCFAKVVMDFYYTAVTSGPKSFVAECLHYLCKALLKNITAVISNAFDCVNGRGYCTVRNMRQLILQDIYED